MLCYFRVYAIAYPSVVCLSSVMFVHPTQPVEILAMFLRHFYLSHSLTSMQKFTEIVPWEPLRRGLKTQEG